LGQDPKFKTNEARVKNRNELKQIIESMLQQQTRQYWIDLLQQHDIPVGPVNTIAEAFSDVQVKERNMIWTLPYGSSSEANVATTNGNSARVVGNPLKFENMDLMRDQQITPPPLLGQHTKSVLSDMLKLSDKEMEELKSQGII